MKFLTVKKIPKKRELIQIKKIPQITGNEILKESLQ